MVLNKEDVDRETDLEKLVSDEEKNEENPEISVIIPIYNVENYIEETLNSVVNQTFRNMEILCIDDGSTDGSAEILRRYAIKDSRIRIHSKENEGAGKARNVGIELSRGKYIYFMDSDDIIDPAALEICYEAAEESGLDIVLFEGEAFYESQELEEAFPGYKTLYHRKKEYPLIYSGRELYILLSENWDCFTHICMKLYRRSYIKDNRISFPENIYYEDEFFNIKAMIHAEKAKVLPRNLYQRRVRENSIMTHTDVIYKRYVSYHECACLILDYIKSTEFDYDTLRCLSFRVYFFLESADKFYKKLDEESRKRAESDPLVRKLDFGLLKPVLECNKHSFFRSAREFSRLKEENESMRCQIKNLNAEKLQCCKELQVLNKEKAAQEAELSKLHRKNEEQQEVYSALKAESNELRKEFNLLNKEKKKQDEKNVRLKEKNNKLKKSNEKHEARLKAIDENAIVLRMDKRVVRFLKAIKRKIKKLFN